MSGRKTKLMTPIIMLERGCHPKWMIVLIGIVYIIVDVWSSDIWSRIGENASQQYQSHVNTRHEVLDWFGPSRGVIALRPVLMYYAIEIGSSPFLSGSIGGFPGMFSASFSAFSDYP
jgi:hypothetical protein